jgi:HK97 family phage portal protein
MDPNNYRLGMAPLKVVLREILGDEEAGQFTTALLKNMGVPGVILSPDEPGDPGPSKDQADAIKDQYLEKFGGEKRGEPLVLTGRMKVEVVSFSPTEMDMTALRRLPEERVCAVLGVPPIIANLGAGLDRSTFSNMDEAGEHFAERKLVPTWRTIEKQLTAQLGPDFDIAENQRLRFDMRDVRALQEELSNLWLRVDRSIRSGWITVAEGKRIVGLEAQKADEVYLRPIVTVAVPAGAEISTIPITAQPQPALDADTG